MMTPNLKSILLVDDDEISNLFNKIFISRLEIDAEVDVVNNGREALDLLKQVGNYENESIVLTPCLLLLDIKMPIMNGWEFLDAFKEQLSEEIQKQVTIVMLTTSEDQGDFIKAMNNPLISEYIQKPLSESKFTTLINKFYSKQEVI